MEGAAILWQAQPVGKAAMARQDKSGHWLGAVFRNVARRVGRTPQDRLAWLLHFAERQRDASDQNIELEELLAEIAAFAIAEGWHTRLDVRPSLSRDDITQLVVEVRSGLDNLFRADPPRPWDFATAGRNLIWSVQRDRAGHAIVDHHGNLADVFIWQVHQLVTHTLDLIGVCRHCSRLFAIRRGGQIYCSNTCSQAVRNARFQAARPRRRRAKS
jgi:hypothetical protein